MINPTAPLTTGLAELGQRWLTRMLTQVCRDPGSAFHGCFDRDWWHYRIRDFPSIILQQGGSTLAAAAQLHCNAAHREFLLSTARAAVVFWNHRATRRGAFEEYYPWEQGYPPLAFSTLAIAQLASQKIVEPEAIRAGVEIATRQLLRRFEGQAANQQVAGLAALAWCRRVFPGLAPEHEFQQLRDRTLALQHSEGWYEEYGGPDLGYLSVTVDCLWDLFDATQDKRYLASIERALEFTRSLIAPTGRTSIGMHNARNTDYLVPYGIVRAAQQLSGTHQAAAQSLLELFHAAAAPNHFFAAVDDRYVCHYIGRSLFRALALLEAKPQDQLPETTPGKISPPPKNLTTASGHWVDCPGTPETGIIVTWRKGGILTCRWAEAEFSDFGWIIEAEAGQFITHWWSDTWKCRAKPDGLIIEGPVFAHQETHSSPAKHMALRIASLTAGRHVISTLKKKLIFTKPPGTVVLRREVTWNSQAVEIIDTFTGLPATAKLTPAPRSSKRHVASADSFHRQDAAPGCGIAIERIFNRGEENTTVTTKVAPIIKAA